MLTTFYGFIFIFPQLVSTSTHLSVTRVGFITAGISLLGVPAMLLGAKLSDRTPAKRHQFVVPCCLIMAFGLAACGFSNAPSIAIPALCFIWIGNQGMQGAWLAIVQGLFRGRSAAAAIAAINTLSILGGFVGPYFMGFLKDVTGNYQRGLVILSIPMLLCAAIMVYLGRKSLRAQEPSIVPVTIADALESPNL